jgi:hypothetical protein
MLKGDAMDSFHQGRMTGKERAKHAIDSLSVRIPDRRKLPRQCRTAGFERGMSGTQECEMGSSRRVRPSFTVVGARFTCKPVLQCIVCSPQGRMLGCKRKVGSAVVRGHFAFSQQIWMRGRESPCTPMICNSMWVGC